MTSQDRDDESPWIGHAEALLRARRFVLVGIATSWTVVLLTHFLVPRAYVCEATMSFPPIIPKVKDDDAERAGVSLAFYRKLTKLLSSEQFLSNGLKAVVAAPEVQNLYANLGRHVVALTTNPAGDVRRMTSDDTVIGAQIEYSAASPEQAKRVVSALTRLCRNAFLNLLLAEHVESESASTNRRRVDLLRKKAKLIYVQESLRLHVKDVSRLVAEFPTVPPALSQQVVDAREEGSRFLSPTMQMVGVKAYQAQTAHDLRVLDGQLSLEALRLAFFRQLDQRIYGAILQSESELPGSVVELIREELARFSSTQSETSDSAALVILASEVDALAGVLGGVSDAARFVQLPTVRRHPRGTFTLGLLALVALAVVVVALARDAWAHSRALAGATGSAPSRQ